MTNETQITTCPGIFSYANVWKPRFDDNRVDAEGEPIPIYSTMFLFEKQGGVAFKKQMDAAIHAAFMAGVKKGWWSEKAKSILKLPLRDGDAELETGQQKQDIYRGKWFFNAVCTKFPPDIMKAEDGQVVEIVDQNEFYSGCIGRLLGNCYPFNTRSKGIAIGLNGVLKLRDGDRLDGRPDVKSAFAAYADEGQTSDDNGEFA